MCLPPAHKGKVPYEVSRLAYGDASEHLRIVPMSPGLLRRQGRTARSFRTSWSRRGAILDGGSQKVS